MRFCRPQKGLAVIHEDLDQRRGLSVNVLRKTQEERLHLIEDRRHQRVPSRKIMEYGGYRDAGAFCDRGVVAPPEAVTGEIPTTRSRAAAPGGHPGAAGFDVERSGS